jgi:predicted Zn-dependent protease
MKKQFVYLLSISLFLFSCQTVPITGRQQLSLIPSEEILSVSFQSYSEYLSKNTIITDTEDARMVKRVGLRIQNAVEQYFSEHNMRNQLQGYKWEFNLIADKSINAWCMPGGKVAVYTGILPIAKNETGIAVVMGHEISHAVAKHGDERMSQGLITQMGGMLLAEALSQKPEETANLYMAAYGIGAQVGVLLPYSRLHESEADRLGLIFMAMAGYDPREAVDFWQRMSKEKQGTSPPEFLSTHPADATRIRNIEQLIPEALTYYRKQ